MKNKILVPDFKDPFNAGQMVGMIVMLVFLDNNKDISEDAKRTIMFTAANNVKEFFDKPVEDIFLMVEGMVGDIGKMK